MTLSSINTNVASLYSLSGLNQANETVTQATQRLSTGLRLNNAGDDVAALSVAIGLKAEVASLKQSLSNISQAQSFLQVADGGLSEILDILESQKALAVQSQSGTLTATERGFLDQEFQELTSEIDRIATNTNFNDIALLDGSLSGEFAVSTETDVATQATASLTWGANIGAGETVILNGVTLTEGVDFTRDATNLQTSIDNMVNALNGSTNTALSAATYSRSGNSLVVTADAGGSQGNIYLVDQGNSTATFTTAGNPLGGNGLYSAQGGADDGLYMGSVTATGTIGDSLITSQNQSVAEATLSFTNDPAEIADGDTIQIDDGEGGTVTFTFRNAPAGNDEIQIGADNEETVQNAVETLSQYTGTDDYGVRQLNFTREGTDLTIESRLPGGAFDTTGGPINLTNGTTGGTLSTTTLNNGTATGVGTYGVTNEDFVGTISGFSATFNGADDITASITVGDDTYTADITNTNVGGDTTVRFSSTGGGFFDVELQGGSGMAVADQTDADTYASRLDSAFAGLTFSQTRIASSFSGTGDLVDAEFRFQLDDFSSVDIDSISVTDSTASGDFTIEIEIDGETFRGGANMGDTIGARETIELSNLSNSNEKIYFINGQNDIDLSSAANASDLQDDLERDFGLGSGSGSVSFNVGSSSSDTISVQIGSATSTKLFDGATLDVLTTTTAATAEGVIDDAIDTLTAIRADVGAAQERLDYAYNSVSSMSTNLDIARGNLEDADIAEESTNLALGTVRQQAAIAAVAQANTLPGNLLDLLRGS